MRYLVVVEEGAENFSAYVPDLPGCVSAGRTYEELMRNIQEAIEGHIGVMREYGEPIPAATSRPEFVDVPVAV